MPHLASSTESSSARRTPWLTRRLLRQLLIDEERRISPRGVVTDVAWVE